MSKVAAQRRWTRNTEDWLRSSPHVTIVTNDSKTKVVWGLTASPAPSCSHLRVAQVYAPMVAVVQVERPLVAVLQRGAHRQIVQAVCVYIGDLNQRRAKAGIESGRR